jgi:hypothetical protein
MSLNGSKRKASKKFEMASSYLTVLSHYFNRWDRTKKALAANNSLDYF